LFGQPINVGHRTQKDAMRRKKTTPKKAGRPRSHAIGPGFRPQLGFTITSELMGKIRAAQTVSGRSQSAECEHRLERSFHSEALLAEANELRFGPEIAMMAELISEAAAYVRLHGNILVNAELLKARSRSERVYLNPGLAEPRIRAAA